MQFLNEVEELHKTSHLILLPFFPTLITQDPVLPPSINSLMKAEEILLVLLLLFYISSRPSVGEFNLALQV